VAGGLVASPEEMFGLLEQLRETPEGPDKAALWERVNRELAYREATGQGISVDPIEAGRFGPPDNPPLENLQRFFQGSESFFSNISRDPEAIMASGGWKPGFTWRDQQLERWEPMLAAIENSELQEYMRGIAGRFASALALPAMAAEPGPGELGLVAREFLPLLAMTLPREVLEWMAKGTRAVDSSGLPTRVLHGTPAAYGSHDPSRWSSGVFGKGHYVTEGAFVGPRGMETNQGQLMNEMFDPQRYPSGPDRLELTTDYFAGKPVRAGLSADSLDYAPNVRGEYLITERPFDFTELPEAPDRVLNDLVRQTTRGWSAESRNRVIEAAKRELAGYQNMYATTTPVNNPRSAAHRPHGVTMGDIWSIAKGAVSEAVGPDGSNQRVTDALWALGYDSIVSRGDAFGNPGYVGPQMWFVNDPNRVIPAGNVPEAMRRLDRAGIIDGNSPEAKALFNQYNELGRPSQ
jgi:hypothetical protein